MPPTLEYYVVPRSVLDSTAAFLRFRGRSGVEGTVLWLGEVRDANHATITEPRIPEQVAYRTEHGLAVEVTRSGLTRLIESLAVGLFALVRVHSHGDAAYHSVTDDENMIISHERAISVVVPNFANGGLDLLRCSVNELRPGRGWVELPARDVRRRFEIR